jgi:hypothetical protein
MTKTLLSLLPLQERRLLVADCADHVLGLWEARYPTDVRPRTAIEAARAYVRGEVDRGGLQAARADVRDAVRMAADVCDGIAYVDACDSGSAYGATRSATYDAASSAHQAARAAWHATGAASVSLLLSIRAARDAARAGGIGDEEAWQAARFSEYEETP